MRTILSLSLSLSLLITACSTSERPTIVPVSEQQVREETRRLNSLQEPIDTEQAMNKFVTRAATRYGDKPFAVITVGTDSQSGGIDDWRTCAKLKPEQLGLPADTLGLFFNLNYQPCSDHPNDYVMMAMFAGPIGLERTVINPTYKTEEMVIMVDVIEVSPR